MPIRSYWRRNFPAFVTEVWRETTERSRIGSKIISATDFKYSYHNRVRTPGIGKPVSPTFLAILALIAALIQIIACINFMNLSTASSSKRAKEVGVRKVIGAGRNDLVRQFLGESFLLSLISVMIALPLLVMALPLLNRITRSDIQISFLKDYRVWPCSFHWYLLLVLLQAVILHFISPHFA